MGRMFCSMYNMYLIRLECDDKAAVPIGEPSFPISAMLRNRKGITGGQNLLYAGDHDFSRFKLTPSLYLVINVPDKPDESFNDGTPYLAIKDAVTEASTAWRAVAEEIAVIRASGSADKPGLYKHTDGGPEHRCRNGSVMMALVAQLKEMDLDFNYAFNSCPNNSYLNAPERVMPLLNLAWNAMSNSRSLMSEEAEHQIKNCSSMAALRKTIGDDDEGLGAAIRASLKPCKDKLNDRAMKMMWKDEHMTQAPHVSEAEVQALFRHIKKIDPTMERHHTTKKDWEGHPVWREWIAKHCFSSWYFFQIKKCLDPACCGEIKMDRDVYLSLGFIPEGELDDSGKHYRPFKDVYRKEQSDPVSLVPSQYRVQKMTLGKGLFVIKNVKGVINCVGCGFPRCVYFDQ
ncbi:unnamed protein product, partial [Heterosigma akashiwo]